MFDFFGAKFEFKLVYFCEDSRFWTKIILILAQNCIFQISAQNLNVSYQYGHLIVWLEWLAWVVSLSRASLLIT